MKYVLIGYKGSGMASLCHILLDKKFEVIGIDTLNYVYTEDKLKERNILTFNFNEYEYSSDDIVIFGHSFKESEEVSKARNIVNEIYEYHEYVSKLVKKSKLSIAISGSHGKTYTTGFISYILDKISNISYLIGDGEGQFKGNDIFVFEACEYQDHFLVYEVDIAIVLNIDYDHVDYFKNEEDYLNTFKKFINNAKVKILNYNDENIKKLNFENAIYYDINKISNLTLKERGYNFNYKNKIINTNVYGVKHIENILSALTLFDYLNIDLNDYYKEISNFNGVKRRFREIIVNGDVYIDDYAHHHTQIQYTIDMIKNKYPDYVLVVFFKPDRPSRFLTFYKHFATSLLKADYVVIMENPSFKEMDIKLLIKENENKFYYYNKTILKKVKEINRKVVVTFSSKNMKEVYENIFINNYL